MIVVTGDLTCDHCKTAVPSARAQLHVNVDAQGRNNGVAWDHRVFSADADGRSRCDRYTPLRSDSGTVTRASARHAARLNKHGSSRFISLVDLPDYVAYYLRDVGDLTWVAAHYVGPAGFEPVISIDGSRSSLSAKQPLGVTAKGEYVWLRLHIGDWFLVSKEDREVVSAFTGTGFRALLRDAGVSDSDFREQFSEHPIS